MDPSLGVCVVELWRLELDAPNSVADRLEAILAPAERARAARFRMGSHRRRYVLRRAALREILGHRLRVSPANVQVSYGRHGKPAVPGGLRFSASHSGGVGLIAVTDGREVGVDVECVRSGFDAAGLSEQHFTQAERDALGAAPTSGFFGVWTLKEALLKAWGVGLLCAPETVDVTPALSAPAMLQDRWTLGRVDAGHGLAAALAVESAGFDISWRRWSP